MATYFISVHTLRHRLHAEQEGDDEHCRHSDAGLDDVAFGVQRSARLKMIERKDIDVRPTSCPATTIATRRPPRVEP